MRPPDARDLARITRARAVVLVLDWDGTLVPLQRTPGAVRITAPVRAALIGARRTPGCRVVILSGRSLRDLRRRVGIRGLIYAGNHGFEIAGPRGRWVHPAARRARPALRALRRQITQALRRFPRAFVEDKTLTLSVHFRRVAPRRRPLLVRRVREALRPWVRRRRVYVSLGKRAIEVRPPVAWGKGHAVRWILRQPALARQALPVVIGDDRTDEDAFRMFRRRGLTVVVGNPRRTAAQCRLAAPAQVLRFLRTVRKARASHA